MNNFQLELVMDEEEQRRMRPTEYRIRNLKKIKDNKKKAKHNPNTVILNNNKINLKRSISPRERSSRNNSHKKIHHNTNIVQSNATKSYLMEEDRQPINKPFNMLSQQPKHIRDPLKYAKPFDIKYSGTKRNGTSNTKSNNGVTNRA